MEVIPCVMGNTMVEMEYITSIYMNGGKYYSLGPGTRVTCTLDKDLNYYHEGRLVKLSPSSSLVLRRSHTIRPLNSNY